MTTYETEHTFTGDRCEINGIALFDVEMVYPDTGRSRKVPEATFTGMQLDGLTLTRAQVMMFATLADIMEAETKAEEEMKG